MKGSNKILTGPKGGKYYINEKGKKVYIKESTAKNISTSSIQTSKKSTTLVLKRCCCCGNELNESDCRYYDLTDYCPRCALADGIISTLE